jgi:hypothetical protein
MPPPFCTQDLRIHSHSRQKRRLRMPRLPPGHPIEIPRAVYAHAKQGINHVLDEFESMTPPQLIRTATVKELPPSVKGRARESSAPSETSDGTALAAGRWAKEARGIRRSGIGDNSERQAFHGPFHPAMPCWRRRCVKT